MPILGSLTVPLMKPLHRTQAAQREAAGRLAALGSDTVAGLRILRGVGGEDVFFENYRRQSQRVRAAGNRIAAPQAGLESGQVLLPAILTGIVTFLGARDVMNGTLQPGELVAFFGYSMFLTTPLRTAIDYVIMSTRAYVGAGKVLRVLAIEPIVKDPEHPVAWPARLTRLEDRRSGLVLERGQLAGLVADSPDDAVLLCDRLGRFVADSDGVFVNGVAIDAYRLDDVRSHIVVSEIEPRLFSGELRYELMPHGLVDDERIYQVLQATSSLDVLDALEDGLSTIVEERGAGSRADSANDSAWREPSSPTPRSRSWSSRRRRSTPTPKDASRRACATCAGSTRRCVATTSPLLLEKMDVVYLVLEGTRGRSRHARRPGRAFVAVPPDRLARGQP